MSDGPTVIFAGPSLRDLEAARQRLDGNYRGPACQGDVVRAALLQPAAIVLIDGYFERVPAVYHKEILWALDRGIAVYGAASMGALRAAELDAFGMTGVGAIYEAFSTGTLHRDDEVALIHAPAEAGYEPLSEPLVNIRWTLEAAVAAGVIDKADSERLVAGAASRFYPERSFRALMDDAGETLSAGAAKRLAGWLETGRIDQKQRDALACLDRVAADRHDGIATTNAMWRLNHTDAFEQLLTEVEQNPSDGGTGPDPENAPLDRLHALSPRAHAALRNDAMVEALALRLDQMNGQPLSPEAPVQEVEAFRARNGISGPDDLAHWLDPRGIDIETLSKFLEERARIERAKRLVADEVEARMLRNLTLGDSGRRPGDR